MWVRNLKALHKWHLKVDYKVGDYKIELKWIDSESDAEKGGRAYEQAIVKDKIVRF